MLIFCLCQLIPVIKMAKTDKCKCNVALLLIALALFSIGAYFLVAAFGAQLRGDLISQQTAVTVVPLYFLGFLVMALGKIVKWKSWECCQMHKK